MKSHDDYPVPMLAKPHPAVGLPSVPRHPEGSDRFLHPHCDVITTRRSGRGEVVVLLVTNSVDMSIFPLNVSAALV